MPDEEKVTVNITVILCTYNRCHSLAKALDSVAAQTLRESVEWEVLVMDNNSRDQTREVVEGFCRRYPGRFRYLFEPQPGKSCALNSGIRHARGNILAFTDDDVVAEPAWLQNLTSPLIEGEWAGVGGRVLPAQSFSPPRWLALEGPYSLGHVLYAHFDQGADACELTEAPFGANMAFRKDMFEKYGDFRTDMGPAPGSAIRYEDVEFSHRLIGADERLRYEPSAIVYHAVPENRLRQAYFLAWCFDLGIASVREWGRGPSLLGIPRPYLNSLKLVTITMAKEIGRWLLSLNPQRRFYRKCFVWTMAGRIKEYIRLVRSALKTDRRLWRQPRTVKGGDRSQRADGHSQ
jgi:glycosyltransferase involved in cell wall biosynthesis